MEFRQDLRNLKKQYFYVIHSFYKASNMIFKMIYEKELYAILCEMDLSFRTADGRCFSDHNIINNHSKNPQKSVELLCTRALACVHIAEVLEELFNHKSDMTNSQLEELKKLYIIHDTLLNMADKSIALSNIWGREINMEDFGVAMNYIINQNEKESAKLK